LHGLDLAKRGLVDAGNAPNILTAVLFQPLHADRRLTRLDLRRGTSAA